MTIGRTREVRGPDALELGVAGVIVAIVAAIAGGLGGRLMLMTQTLDAISAARAPQVNAVVYRAEHGRWPAAGDRHLLGETRTDSRVTGLALEHGGVVTAELILRPTLWLESRADVAAPAGLHGRLSFRPELMGSADAPAVSFLCGYATPGPGTVEADAVNRTSLPPEYLPPFCR